MEGLALESSVINLTYLSFLGIKNLKKLKTEK